MVIRPINSFLSKFGVRAAVALLVLAPGAALGGKPCVGVVMPKAQLGQGSTGQDVATPVRDLLLSYLKGPAVDVVPIEARLAVQAEAEAVQKNCGLLLYTTVEQKKTKSMGGLFRAAAPLASALPYVGGIGGTAGSYATAAAVQTAVQTAAAQEMQQQALASLTSAQQGSVKKNDQLSFDFKLQAIGAKQPAAAGKFEGKATENGQDLISPLVEKVAGEVLTAAVAK